MSTRRIGELRDYVCRECGLYVMLDVTGFDSDYDEKSGQLYDILDDSDGCRKGDQIICECGCDAFDVLFSGPPLFGPCHDRELASARYWCKSFFFSYK